MNILLQFVTIPWQRHSGNKQLSLQQQTCGDNDYTYTGHGHWPGCKANYKLWASEGIGNRNVLVDYEVSRYWLLPSKAKFNNHMFLTSIFLVGMNAAGELKPGQQQFPLTSQGWTLGAGFSVVTSLSWPGEPENCKNSNKIASKRKRRHFNWSRVPGTEEM